MQTKINEISQQKSVKCKNCRLRQKQAAWKRDASVQLLVPLDDKNVWLTAFTDGLESLLATHPTLSLLNVSDTIVHEELPVDITDMTSILHTIGTESNHKNFIIFTY